MNTVWTTATDAKSTRGPRRKPRSFLLRDRNKNFSKTLTSDGIKWSMVDAGPIISPESERSKTPYGPALKMAEQYDWKKYHNFETLKPH